VQEEDVAPVKCGLHAPAASEGGGPAGVAAGAQSCCKGIGGLAPLRKCT
jgi:hypothetical protein